jgi:lipopolysaccharide transport system ATP-binding protein
MNSPIVLDGISKCYRIFQSPQDRFKQALFDRIDKLRGIQTRIKFYREHWALRDISFELKRGEALGVLGRNGAGKSTLLQIIAGTLAPTYGNVTTQGLITALLELGSGFNPEFTGRENVYLNAQILGMTKDEALSRFDDIASFADIGDFIEQPVKTYSSGMMMRLAFAVQTAVEPSVLIVDEALSVGDMFFQAKCMARMKKLLDDGVSLLFVSHDVGSVRQICDRSILLDAGRVTYLGDATTGADMYNKIYLNSYNEAAKGSEGDVLNHYPSLENYDTAHESNHRNIVKNKKTNCALPSHLADTKIFDEKSNFERLGNGAAAFLNVTMSGINNNTNIFSYGEEIVLHQLIKFNKNLASLNIGYKFRTMQGLDAVFGDLRLFGDTQMSYEKDGIYLFSWKFILNMGHGVYNVTSCIAHPPDGKGREWEFIDYIPISFQFTVLPREEGMVDGLCVFDADLNIDRLDV